MKRVTLQVRTEVGLHARPAALLVQQAGRFHSQIALRNLTAQSAWVNAKSILSVLTLGVEKDQEIELEANGPDEGEAVAALSALVRYDFGGVQPVQ
jgi:phosphotransferase system HPr (HPr) family protein